MSTASLVLLLAAAAAGRPTVPWLVVTTLALILWILARTRVKSAADVTPLTGQDSNVAGRARRATVRRYWWALLAATCLQYSLLSTTVKLLNETSVPPTGEALLGHSGLYGALASSLAATVVAFLLIIWGSRGALFVALGSSAVAVWVLARLYPLGGAGLLLAIPLLLLLARGVWRTRPSAIMKTG